MRDDGFVFISIDDHEVANLRLLCNEIFGEDNFIANVVWQKKYTRANDAKYFSDNHDHILVYARTKDAAKLNLQQRTEDQASAYSNPDNHPKGPWKATPLHAKSGNADNFRYVFNNGVVWTPPPGTYPRFSLDTFSQLDLDNEIWFGADGNATPSRKTFLSEAKAGVTPITIWTYDEVGHNHEANNELKALDLAGLFDNPKPSRLIRRMLELSTNDTDGHLVLDFFAGSGTTAQAVMDANSQDGGNRHFILVQLPEPTDRSGFKTIADIMRERVRRVAKRLDETAPGIFSGSSAALDNGFKSFYLDTSNFTAWNASESRSEPELSRQLELHVEHIRQNRSPSDILFEILSKSGYPLTARIEEVRIADKSVYSVHDGVLMVCLERMVTLECIRSIASQNPERVVCLDEAFAGSDQLKANAVQLFKAKGITFRTI
jgi:adenine-specific DNA-methyltransferase